MAREVGKRMDELVEGKERARDSRAGGQTGISSVWNPLHQWKLIEGDGGFITYQKPISDNVEANRGRGSTRRFAIDRRDEAGR